MANSRSSPVSTIIAFLTLAGTTFLFAVTCMAQDNPQTEPPSPPDSQTSLQAAATPPPVTETIPAGTRVVLVLTHPIQSRYIHRGDDIYAQITAPIVMGNAVVIPPGTLVDGIVDKLERRGGRAELRLQSLSMMFPDGYVAPVPGPAVMESVEGYALTDPGSKRGIAMFALPAAGAGLGALIGHSAGKPASNVTSAFPPGCVGGPPFCSSVSTPVAGTQGRDAIIGAGIGTAIGVVVSMTVMFSSHQFFLDVGSPVDMVLRQPLTLDQVQMSEAVRQSEQQPVLLQPVARRPVPPPPPDTGFPASTPGTPPTIIPGAPGPGGIPGPPIIIPGTPPGTP